jgi:beta-aspartyl-dipeptidase (metallo-type)
MNEGVTLDQLLPYFCSNVAAVMRLSGKGSIAVGQDADLLVLSEDLGVHHLMANGRWHIKNGEQHIFGSYEAATSN